MDEKTVVKVPEILLPNKDIDVEKWSVVACDQYTSQPEYWKDVETIIGKNPSTLKIIYPEVYLDEEGKENRIKNINNNMNEYIGKSILESIGECFVYVERTFETGQTRKGLMLSIDLEHYDYNKGSESLIRATEGTVLDRLPPRIKVRENASLEIPHIMLLIDDPDKNIIEYLGKNKDNFEKIYDSVLMKNGGEIKGYKISDENQINRVLNGIQRLCDKEVFLNKYNLSKDMPILLFAAGDGNHSLATAKACWENIKKDLSDEELFTHPARFALVEVVNLHDESLVFEPIHRVLFDVDYENFIIELKSFFQNKKNELEIMEINDLNLKNIEFDKSTHIIPFITNSKNGIIKVINPKNNLEVGTLQSFLDYYISKYKNKIDYIHGNDVLYKLAKKDNNIGFYLPAMNKNDLFKTVILDGSLPRKTFSMGEAEEKRYYLECKKIK